MLHVFRNRNFYVVCVLDAMLVCLSLYLAYAVRFEFQFGSHDFAGISKMLPYIIVIKLCTFFFFHLYQGMWRYTSLVDMLNVVKAVAISSLLVIVAVLVLYRFQGYPRSVFFIDWAITLILIGGFRLAIRLYFTRNAAGALFSGLSTGQQERKRLLIIGAGDTGEKVVREMLERSHTTQLLPIGFLDDDAGKHGRTIHGVSVLGTVEQIDRYEDSCDEILIAIPSASSDVMRRIVTTCEKIGKPFRTLPALSELIDGSVSLKTVRNVTMQDLLGRKEVKLSAEQITEYLRQKRVMITGAGGSIGSELVRQATRFYPAQIALVDMSEYNLFQIETECRRRFPYIDIEAFLVDIRDLTNIDRVFTHFRPQVVFHAAAYKHVPLQELNPWEAVLTNVGGTHNLIQVAQEHKVHRFVLVSTDKAVRPSNVMGATKRVAEKLVECANGTTNSHYMAVRFGNVLGSSGSVIPTFQAQIDRGGPVTVTHPEVIRYFMSISEASQLILEAGAMGQGSEVFILEMGEPVRIVDLAQDLIRLNGYNPETEIGIEFVGLRPGEKLYEELITEGEGIVETGHEKILVLRGEHGDAQKLATQFEDLIAIARTYDTVLIKQKLQEIVPEYTPSF